MSASLRVWFTAVDLQGKHGRIRESKNRPDGQTSFRIQEGRFLPFVP